MPDALSAWPGLYSRQFDTLTGVPELNVRPSQTQVVEPPSIQVLTTAQAKEFIPIHDAASDALVDLLVQGCAEDIGRYVGTDLTPRVLRSFWVRPAPFVRLSQGPHGDIVEVESSDGKGESRVLTPGQNYYVEGDAFKSIRFTGDALIGPYLTVTYHSGYADGLCPAALRAAVLQEVSLQYKNRQDPMAPGRVVVDGLTVETRNLVKTYIRHAR